MGFAAEFLHLQQLWLVSTGLHLVWALHERMAEMLPEQPYTDHIYGPWWLLTLVRRCWAWRH